MTSIQDESSRLFLAAFSAVKFLCCSSRTFQRDSIRFEKSLEQFRALTHSLTHFIAFVKVIFCVSEVFLKLLFRVPEFLVDGNLADFEISHFCTSQICKLIVNFMDENFRKSSEALRQFFFDRFTMDSFFGHESFVI